jgi:RNA polymerase sigma factor, sigma-70 family
MQEDETSTDGEQPVEHLDLPPEPSGSEISIEQMYRKYRDPLVRFLRLRLRSSDEANEVAQEAFLQLLKMNNLSTVHQPIAYLFRTAINIATNRGKLGNARRRLDELASLAMEQSDHRTPQQTVDMQQQLQRISETLERLPDDCKAVFILVRFQDKSVEEAGIELGIHPRTVRRLLARAFKSCKRAVG